MMEQISGGHPDISASNGIINAANQLERLLTKVTKQPPSTNAVLQPQTSTAGSAATSNSNSSQRGRPVSTPSNNLFSSCFNDTQKGKNVLVLDPKPTKKQQSDLKKMDKQRRTVILIKQSLESFSNINSLELRTKINAELSQSRQAIGAVIATITKSIAKNLIITTTSDFSADFLLEHTDILAKHITFKEAKKDTTFYKVAVHGVTLQFDNHDMPQMIRDEISTFNKPLNLKVVGTPYWLTSESKRLGGQRAASMVIAFATEEEQTRAIRNRLNIGGVSVRVEKLFNVMPSTQCSNCYGYGHLQQRCPKSQPNCGLCAGKHHTREHAFTTCNIMARHCEHTIYKCANCGDSHAAYSKECPTRPSC